MLRELSTTRYNEKTHLTVGPDIFKFLTILGNSFKCQKKTELDLIPISYVPHIILPHIIWGSYGVSYFWKYETLEI